MAEKFGFEWWYIAWRQKHWVGRCTGKQDEAFRTAGNEVHSVDGRSCWGSIAALLQPMCVGWVLTWVGRCCCYYCYCCCPPMHTQWTAQRTRDTNQMKFISRKQTLLSCPGRDLFLPKRCTILCAFGNIFLDRPTNASTSPGLLDGCQTTIDHYFIVTLGISKSASFWQTFLDINDITGGDR